MEKKTKEQKQEMIYSFFKMVLEDYLSKHPEEEDNPKIYQALMTITI